MPFKSEKQRRYLWANEPQIARDWTNTYGSKIHKAEGGRIGFYRGSDRHAGTGTSQSQAPSSGPHGNQGSSRGSARGPRDAPDRHGSTRTSHHPGVHRGGYTPTPVRSGINRPAPREDADPGNYFSKANYVRRSLSPNFLGSVNPFDKKDYLAWAKQNEEDSLINEGVYGDRPGWQITKDAEMLNKLEKLGVKSYGDINRLTQSDFETLMPDWQKNPGGEGGGGEGQPYIWPYPPTGIAALEEDPTQETLVSDTDWNFVLPERFLKGPRVAQVAEGGRVPAAFGGIMDTTTGRRAYGFGSIGSVFKSIARIPKKAAKAVKKIAKSPIGKLALGYLATAGIGNLMQPGAAQWGSPLGKGSGWLRPGQVMSNWSNLMSGTSGLDKLNPNEMKNVASGWKGIPSKVMDFAKTPTGMITLGGAGIGAASAMGPQQIEADIGGERSEEKAWWDAYLASLGEDRFEIEDKYKLTSADGGRVPAETGGLMNLGGLEKDYRNEGGFVPIGVAEKADDVPARLSKNEFVMTADAVRGAGGGDIDRGAQVMETVMDKLQGKHGRQEMFETSERLSEVI